MEILALLEKPKWLRENDLAGYIKRSVSEESICADYNVSYLPGNWREPTRK